MKTALIIGSRGSQLALWQANHIKSCLEALGAEVRIEIIRTTGDKITDVPLAKVGGKGLFTKEIEEALLDGRIDLAVHSLKDLPTELPAGLTLAAVPERELPYDALLGAKLSEIPQGARVGTSSLRRSAQLRALRPDLVLENIRGNLDTRIRKLDEGQYDAILLAAAGLRRLGWENRIAELLPPEAMCPAVGQGALGIETRDHGPALEICRKLEHAPTRAAVEAERALLAGLGGGCQVPIGAHATVERGCLKLRAVVAHPGGSTILRHQCEGAADDAKSVGTQAAKALLDAGARDILVEVYGETQPLKGKRVVVTRAREQAGPFADQLRRLGAEVVELPAIELAAIEFTPVDLTVYDWLVFTSANGVRFFFRTQGRPVNLHAKIAVVGPATAWALQEFGLTAAIVAEEHAAEGLLDALANVDLSHNNILLPVAASTRDVLPRELTARGANVATLPVYRNTAPEGLEQAAQALFTAGPKPEWITFMSPSAVKNILAAAGHDALSGVKIASIGGVTSEAIRKHGLTVTVEADPSTAEALAEAMARSEL